MGLEHDVRHDRLPWMAKKINFTQFNHIISTLIPGWKGGCGNTVCVLYAGFWDAGCVLRMWHSCNGFHVSKYSGVSCRANWMRLVFYRCFGLRWEDMRMSRVEWMNQWLYQVGGHVLDTESTLKRNQSQPKKRCCLWWFNIEWIKNICSINMDCDCD